MDFDFKDLLNEINRKCKNTLAETLSITFIEVGLDFVKASMPVTASVCQPEGLLHGGVSAALAETVGSVAAMILPEKSESKTFRGIHVSSNHIRGVRSGLIYAKAIPIHIGRTIQHWDIPIVDDNEVLISSNKLTTIALDKT